MVPRVAASRSRWPLAHRRRIGFQHPLAPRAEGFQYLDMTPSRTTGTYAGVDVGGRRKGFHCAVLVGDAVCLSRHADAEGVIEVLVESNALLTAIDSPRTLASEGRKSRQGERDLVAAGVCGIRYTPDRIGSNPSYYEWIECGLELFAACATAGIRTIECFPTASWTRWLGPRGSRSRAAWTRDGLLRHRLEGVPARQSQDDRDAIAAALTARADSMSATEAFGEIVVPLADSLPRLLLV